MYDGGGPIALPPTGAVLITELPESGSTLRADTSTIADANGLGTFSYQWFADGGVIDGANSDSFTPGAAQIGRAITVRVSYTDGIGTAESLTSARTAAIRTSDNGLFARLLAITPLYKYVCRQQLYLVCLESTVTLKSLI